MIMILIGEGISIGGWVEVGSGHGWRLISLMCSAEEGVYQVSLEGQRGRLKTGSYQ